MNTNLLNIVNRIVAEQGEGILADAKRLFPFFADYAKNEYKEDRVAFGRCIEMGAYQELKKARTADERQRVKATLVDQMNAKTGIDRNRCADALDLLEAVIFKSGQQSFTSPSQAKVCSNCGGIINAGEKFCAKCGTPITAQQRTVVPAPVSQYTPPPTGAYNSAAPGQTKANDESSFGYAFLGFLVPIAGIILFLVWKEVYPLRAKSCRKGAIIGFCVSVVMGIIMGAIIGALA
jgi:hypothetical protein